MVIGFVLQAVALTLLFWRLRRGWLTHIGAIFIIAACVLHGLGEILMIIFPGRSIYRTYLGGDTQALDQFVLYVSATILLATVTYLIALGRRPQTATNGTRGELRTASRLLDWRILTLAALPLIVLTARGSGYYAATGASGNLTVDAGLAEQFMLLLVPLAAFGFVARYGRRWLLPALAAAIAATVVTGQREQIVIVAVAILYTCARFGIRLSRRALVASIIVAVGLGWVITSARANVGRSNVAAGTSVTQKVAGLRAGLDGLTDQATLSLIAHDAGYRLDGNTWGAMILQATDGGLPAPGPQSLLNDYRNAIPSFLYRTKVDQSRDALYEPYYQADKLGFPAAMMTEALPTQFGTILGYWGPGGLLLAGAAVGAMLALVDRWLLRRPGPAQLLIGVGFVICAVFYERPLNIWPDTLRGVLLVAAAVGALDLVRRSVIRPQLHQRPAGRPLPTPQLGRATGSAGGRYGDFHIDWE